MVVLALSTSTIIATSSEYDLSKLSETFITTPKIELKKKSLKIPRNLLNILSKGKTSSYRCYFDFNFVSNLCIWYKHDKTFNTSYAVSFFTYIFNFYFVFFP